jgi:carbonic anhydrase
MDNAIQTSRRNLVLGGGLAAGAFALGSFPHSVAAQTGARPKPVEVLQRLMEGNKRFVEGKLTHPGRAPKDFQPLAEGQAPLAIILGCADSRVSPEIVFDQGVGDLFVVRVAGNMVGSGPILKGSIEFAVAELGARVIMVLGHSACGACKAAIAHIDNKDALPGSIEGVVEYIRPSVREVTGKPGDKLANVTKANVLAGVKKLQTLDPILSKFTGAGDLKVVGGVYDLASGKVELVS